MGKVEEIREESTRAVWVTPTLSELGVGQTLTGAFRFATETFDDDGRAVGGPTTS